VELLVTSRRGRYFAARVVYGLFLLITLWAEFRSWGGLDPRFASIYNMGRFAESTFVAFAGTQGFALLVLVPALVAGTIAEERQRRTLPDLLTTDLTTTEIVLGKLGARLLHAAVFLLLGLPIVCLVGLFGGLDPRDVLAVTLGTSAITLFVAGLSMLVSVVAPRPRRAIVTAYSLVATWLFLPFILAPLAPHFAWPLWWVRPVNDAVLLTNPIAVWSRLSSVVNARIYMVQHFPWNVKQTNEAINALMTMAWLQMVFGIVFLVLAVWSLRRSALDRGSVRSRKRAWPWSRWRSRSRPSPRVLARPACGDDPMLWKERHAPGDGGRLWLSSRPVVLVLGVALGCFLYDSARPALVGLFRPGVSHQSVRESLNQELRVSGAFVLVIAGLAVAGAAAASVSEEREQGTWTSLRTTLLTEREIVRAKLFGAFWSARRLIVALLAIWGVGLLSGAIRPLGFLAALLFLGAFLGFVAALGLAVSLRARTTSRALVTAIGVLTAVNLGVLMIGRVFDAPDLLAGSAPLVAWLAPAGPQDITDERHAVVIVVLGLVVHALAALVLIHAARRAIAAERGEPPWKNRSRRSGPPAPRIGPPARFRTSAPS